MEPTLEKRHIEITPGVCGGRARIAGHRIRVQDIVLWTEQGQSPDQIVADFPQLSLADVYTALAYYHDHREEIDRQIREDDQLDAHVAHAGIVFWHSKRRNVGQPVLDLVLFWGSSD